VKLYQGIIFGSVAILIVAFNNCSHVGFGASGSDSSVGGLGNPNPAPNPNPNPTPTPVTPSAPDPRVPQIVQNCKDAITAGTIKTMDQTIDFNDSHQETGLAQVCAFDQGDNLSEVDGFMRARYEQDRTLNLPANAVICDVQMTTPAQKFTYDDILFLTYNGRIMGSDNKTSITTKLQPDSSAQLANGQLVPLYTFDWLGIRNAPFANVADNYCLGTDQGAGTCMWPVTETTGDIVFQFDPQLLIAIALKAPANQQTFGFVVTGDNDPKTDCAHSDLQFAMHVKYYLQ
jgi:hypothetical protein